MFVRYIGDSLTPVSGVGHARQRKPMTIGLPGRQRAGSAKSVFGFSWKRGNQAVPMSERRSLPRMDPPQGLHQGGLMNYD